MDSPTPRDTVARLGDDFRWLSNYLSLRGREPGSLANLLLAGALVRNVLSPALQRQASAPLHLAVVGGAGAGKSTIVNFLCGQVVAESNPQAGYTRHPTAFLPSQQDGVWPTTLGFLGELRRLPYDAPGNLDEEVYQVRQLPAQESANPLADFVVWDCPDMTTWASTGYTGRLLEIAALADIVVYVASDERYNDAVPTEFLKLLIAAGKPIVVCLTKMRESEAALIIQHFRQEVLGKLFPTLQAQSAQNIPPIPCIALSHLSQEEQADPSGIGGKYRAQLLNQILVVTGEPAQSRTRTVANALQFVEIVTNNLGSYVSQDLAEADAWRTAVDNCREQFEDRYRKEVLTGEPFQRFDRTRDQILEMLELPGSGRAISNGLAILRMPYAYLRDALGKLIKRPTTASLSEYSLCSVALTAWLDQLHADALRRRKSHPLWQQIANGFDQGLANDTRNQFEKFFESFEKKEVDDLDQEAQKLPQYLTDHPGSLNFLRAGVLGADVAALGFAVWLNFQVEWAWYHLLLIPLSVSLSRQLIEIVVTVIVDSRKNAVREQRIKILRDNLSFPLADWLIEWPTNQGSDTGRIRAVLNQIPQAVRELAPSIRTSDPLDKKPAIVSTSPDAV